MIKKRNLSPEFENIIFVEPKPEPNLTYLNPKATQNKNKENNPYLCNHRKLVNNFTSIAVAA